MKKYTSFHFSPLNNRSMLMPRIPKGEKYHRENRLKLSFSPISEDQLNKKDPYFQQNTGFYSKVISVSGEKRAYGMYVPEGMMSKGACIVLFLDSGEKSEDFLTKENWKILSDQYHVAFIILESESWKKAEVETEFDYAWTVISDEFQNRWTVDICESFIYPIGLGEGAYVATAFALTYSATFPAFAADGDCNIDPELLATLRDLPSDGVETLKKTDIPISAFMIDRYTENESMELDVFSYVKEILRSREEELYNSFGRVYLENPIPGAYFVNEQPIAQAYLGTKNTVKEKKQKYVNEEMVRFVLRFARWGGFKNNHLRLKRSYEEMGMIRQWKMIGGLRRYYDIYVPSCYRPGDGKQYPLVLAIHGFSCNAEYFEETSDWHRIAEERGFFVVFAAAYPRNVGRSRFPLPGWCVWPLEEEGIDECQYFKDVLDEVEERYAIDKRRVYVVGHSNGGRMVQTLSRKMPERFAAFSPTGALGGSDAGAIEPIEDHIKCPIWFMMGEYDLADPDSGEGSTARATLEAYCKANRMTPGYENWYDNGRYHTLVMYDEKHVPMVQYTIMIGCPHTYTAEMAQMTWDHFLCHFTRERDGAVQYHG